METPKELYIKTTVPLKGDYMGFRECKSSFVCAFAQWYGYHSNGGSGSARGGSVIRHQIDSGSLAVSVA